MVFFFCSAQARHIWSAGSTLGLLSTRETWAHWSEYSRGDQPGWGYAAHDIWGETLRLGTICLQEKGYCCLQLPHGRAQKSEAGPCNRSCFEQEVELETDVSSTWVILFSCDPAVWRQRQRGNLCVQRHPYPRGGRRSNLPLRLFPLLYTVRPAGRKMSWTSS